jgi:putative transposase
VSARKELVERSSGELTLKRQCELLSVGRTSLYYTQKTSAANKNLMDRIDELFTEDPTRGTRRLSAALRNRFGLFVGRGKVRHLMSRMGLAAIYRMKNTSKSNKAHKKYPYLLRGMKIVRPNQVWSTDITYVRLRGGFVYLCAIMDWYSRSVLSWRLSTTMGTEFCLQALQEALDSYGTPEIFNTDQGSQFTCEAFTGILKKYQIKISMDGRGRALDNVFVERLWRTVKYEDIYIKDYQSLPECRRGLEEFFDRYNNRREHSSLDYKYPMNFYLESIKLQRAA